METDHGLMWMKYCNNNNKNLLISWKRRWEKFNGRNNGDISYLTEKATCTDCLTLTFFSLQSCCHSSSRISLERNSRGHISSTRCGIAILSMCYSKYQDHHFPIIYNAMNIHQTTITLNQAHLPLFSSFPFAASLLPPQAIDGNSSSDLLGLEKWWKNNNLFGV